jgi:hypothetical protein
VTLADFLALATQEQVKACDDGRIIWIRSKSESIKFEKAGIKLVRENSRNWYIDYTLARELSNAMNVHRDAVTVVCIDEKYSDDSGAFEVVTVADENGKQWKVGNRYDSTVCFRDMSRVELLAYVNK